MGTRLQQPAVVIHSSSPWQQLSRRPCACDLPQSRSSHFRCRDFFVQTCGRHRVHLSFHASSHTFFHSAVHSSASAISPFRRPFTLQSPDTPLPPSLGLPRRDPSRGGGQLGSDVFCWSSGVFSSNTSHPSLRQIYSAVSQVLPPTAPIRPELLVARGDALLSCKSLYGSDFCTSGGSRRRYLATDFLLMLAIGLLNLANDIARMDKASRASAGNISSVHQIKPSGCLRFPGIH